MQELLKQFTVNALQIVCHANNDVLFERFKKRARSGMRHEGHVDAQSSDELKQNLVQERPLILEIEGHVIQVDTTDFDALNYESVLEQVQTFMNNSD